MPQNPPEPTLAFLLIFVWFAVCPVMAILAYLTVRVEQIRSDERIKRLAIEAKIRSRKPDFPVSEGRIVEFLRTALRDNGPGLAISRWKRLTGWTQSEVEEMLDFLAEKEIITPRQNGKACEWVEGQDFDRLMAKIYS